MLYEVITILEEPVPPTLQINPPPQRKPRRFVAQSAAAALLLTVGLLGGFYLGLNVITSYSIHYTKLYEISSDQKPSWMPSAMKITRKVIASTMSGDIITTNSMPLAAPLKTKR